MSEPWAPQIGQRVRTNVSPDCSVHGELWAENNHETGVVIDLGATIPGHPYWVRFDAGDWRGWADAYCAAELEPVDEARTQPTASAGPERDGAI